MAALLWAGLGKFTHLFSKDIHLDLLALFQTDIRGSCGLRWQWQGDALSSKHPVSGLQKGKRPANAKIGCRLIDDLSGLNRGDAQTESGRKHGFKRLCTLTSDQGGKNCHHAAAVIQIVLKGNLVKGKVSKELGKFRICFQQSGCRA